MRERERKRERVNRNDGGKIENKGHIKKLIYFSLLFVV